MIRANNNNRKNHRLQQPEIPYRRWNVYIDGPCNKGLQLDDEIIQYIEANMDSMSDLYLLGVRYYESHKPSKYRKAFHTNYDIQLGITETCLQTTKEDGSIKKEDPRECSSRGILEELQCEIRVNPIHEITPPLKPNARQIVHKYIYRIGSNRDYGLFKRKIQLPQDDSRPKIKIKTVSVIIGKYDDLLPILNNFDLTQVSSMKDHLIYPVLYPLKRLTYQKKLFLQVKNSGNSMNRIEHENLFSGNDSLFEYPEEIIIPYKAPDFYQLVQYAIQNFNEEIKEKMREVIESNKSNNNKSKEQKEFENAMRYLERIFSMDPHKFYDRINMFMKYMEAKRLNLHNIKIKESFYKNNINKLTKNIERDSAFTQLLIFASEENPFETNNPFNHSNNSTPNPFDNPTNKRSGNPFNNNPVNNSTNIKPPRSRNPFNNKPGNPFI